jgi:hypothetical protein
MATRLLSFLTAIEEALPRESAAKPGPAWTCQRMVNFKDGLARMTMLPPEGAGPAVHGGSIFLQSFLLADGSLCLKASLGWDGSAGHTPIAVYATPQLDWSAEARKVAAAWLAGPPAATATVDAMPVPKEIPPSIAVAS